MSNDKVTAIDIVNDERELFLNSPVGYPFAERINQREESRLKGFLISLFTQGDDAMGDAIRQSTVEQCIQSFLDNNFTFDEQYYGVREIPLGSSGQPLSRLDDPEYRRSIGIAT